MKRLAMIRLRWANLVILLMIIMPIIYLVVKETETDENSINNFEDDLNDDGADEPTIDRLKRELSDSDNNLQAVQDELNAKFQEYKDRENELKVKLKELQAKLSICAKRDQKNAESPTNITRTLYEVIPTVFVVTPTFKRFVQKAELTQVSNALKGVQSLHWIIVEDSDHKSELVKNLASRSGLNFTHLNYKTPLFLRRQKGEFRRFKPRGVYQRNLAIQWIRDNVNHRETPGVVYFADDDNTYDSELFEKMRWINGVGVWPVAFTGAARWAGPVCRDGRVVDFHANWGLFRPFPIDMAGFAINIRKLIVDHPRAEFKALQKPGMLESSLLTQITKKGELETLADDCKKGTRRYRNLILIATLLSNQDMEAKSKMDEEAVGATDNIVTEFATYEDFLDSQITPLDLYYLEDEELARQLVELGYRGSGEVLKREEFEARKQAAEASRLSKRSQQKTLASSGKELKDPFLKALAQREEANRSGKMTVSVFTMFILLLQLILICCSYDLPPQSIIFIRDKNPKGQEISGYIDYAHRLKTEDFEPYFNGRRRLLPRPSDLSFYNWETQTATSNPTPNYQVIAENSIGLLFKNKRDRKILNVDPKAPTPGDNSARITIESKKYIQVVIYDHITRRKT
ncbi:uncharacterized protein LOC5501385 isoform X2 [Nematostella vectensis]|uniref:uncharacterized protein LOC5501385 isoform X2 n=1 Tax=Nematostella vectensis TaxID=45351 RepID=UPI0020770081|nr:uncharacterized protein LOC5501385 isoform X2 [Nematostella vectensis]